MSLPDQNSEILKTLRYLSSVIESIKKPLGTRENPVRVCKDLLDCHHTLKDGWFWIDPNLGCTSDAFEVFCNFTAGGQTCLHPLASNKMVFGVGKVQMKFLHLLSTEASHSITLHCLSDPPYDTTDNFSSSGPIPKENTRLRFRGWNKQMFEKDTLLEPHVLQDECKIQDGSWHQSRFFFHTQDSRQLPIVDIQEFPTSQPNSQQHIEIGPVCFLWHQHHRPVTYSHKLLKHKAVTKMAAYQREAWTRMLEWVSKRVCHVRWRPLTRPCVRHKCPISNRRQAYMEQLNLCGQRRTVYTNI